VSRLTFVPGWASLRSQNELVDVFMDAQVVSNAYAFARFWLVLRTMLVQFLRVAVTRWSRFHALEIGSLDSPGERNA
jgi:hypothetical protein